MSGIFSGKAQANWSRRLFLCALIGVIGIPLFAEIMGGFPLLINAGDNRFCLSGWLFSQEPFRKSDTFVACFAGGGGQEGTITRTGWLVSMHIQSSTAPRPSPAFSLESDWTMLLYLASVILLAFFFDWLCQRFQQKKALLASSS